MGSEQDRGWTIKTERGVAGVRGGAKSFFESQATHPTYGETTPARSIDEETAYQETLARIARIESQAAAAMPLLEMEELEAGTQANDQVLDPLAAEFSQNIKPLNLTRRVENALVNHKRIPKRRPTVRLSPGKLK